MRHRSRSVCQSEISLPQALLHALRQSLMSHEPCVPWRIYTMRRRFGDRSAGSSVPSQSQLDRARTRFSTVIDRFDHYNIRHKQQWSDPATFNNTSDKFEFGCQAAAHMSGMSTLTWKILIEANKHPSTPYDWKRRIIFHVALCVNHFGGINVSYVNFYTSPVFSAPAGGYPIGIS